MQNHVALSVMRNGVETGVYVVRLVVERGREIGNAIGNESHDLSWRWRILYL